MTGEISFQFQPKKWHDSEVSVEALFAGHIHTKREGVRVERIRESSDGETGVYNVLISNPSHDADFYRTILSEYGTTA